MYFYHFHFNENASFELKCDTGQKRETLLHQVNKPVFIHVKWNLINIGQVLSSVQVTTLITSINPLVYKHPTTHAQDT